MYKIDTGKVRVRTQRYTDFHDYKNYYIFVSIETKLLLCPGTKPRINKEDA